VTGRELVTATLKLIGVLAPGEAPAAHEATDSLATLNRMLGAWSTEGLLINAVSREAFTLTPNDGDYMIGVGGDFDTARPQQILNALIRDQSGTPALEYPVTLLSLDEWAGLLQKETSSSHPRALYDDGGYPLRKLSLYPKPSAAHQLVLYTLKPFTEVSTLDTEVTLPPGSDEALIYNLAIRLAPEYGRPVTAEIVMLAGDAKAGLKRMNHRPSLLRSDSGTLLRSGSFDIHSGGTR
jgi:hypothetical protein